VSDDTVPDVVTVTANPAVDQTVWVPGFRVGAVNRVERTHTTAGGKGVNVAAALAGWGLPVVATGFLGTANRAVFDEFFAGAAIDDRFVPVPGTTRTGVKVVDPVAGETTDLNFPGLEVGPDEVAGLEKVVADLAAPGRWVVLAGSLPVGAPVGLYRTLAELVHDHGGLVALDTSGPALAAATSGPVDLLKPNHHELEELVGRQLGDRGELLAAARELAGDTRTVAVSLGAEGAVFVRGDEAVLARPPVVEVASTVGAGDAMVAGTVAATVAGRTLRDAAALATAFSAHAVSRVGAHLDAAAVTGLIDAVQVEELS
jgi:1-phosphofructokinase